MAHLSSQHESFEIGIDQSFQILNLNFYSSIENVFVKNYFVLNCFDVKNKF